jgi:hypothetical protein
MRKFTFRLTVALITFLIGIAIAAFWVFRHKEEIPALQIKANVPKGWQKIDERKFAIYLPPEMKQCPEILVGNVGPPMEGWNAYAQGDLIIRYDWFKRGDRSPCGFLPTAPGYSYKSSEIKVAGKLARLDVWEYPAGSFDEGGIDLCFPDIGDGKTWLSVRAFGRDKRALNLARQIFDSVEFR